MIAPTITNIGKQQAEAALKKLTQQFEREEMQILVGVPEGAGSYDSEGGQQLTIATIAAVNEFGTADGRIPARPFLSTAIEEGAPKFVRTVELGLPKVLSGEQPMSWLMHRVGNIAKGEVQQKITDIKNPPNAPATIAKKGSSNPLIDTGALRNSIDYLIIDDTVPIEEGIDTSSGSTSFISRVINRVRRIFGRGNNSGQ